MSEIRNYPSVNDFKQLADENSEVRFVSKNNEMFGRRKIIHSLSYPRCHLSHAKTTVFVCLKARTTPFCRQKQTSRYDCY